MVTAILRAEEESVDDSNPEAGVRKGWSRPDCAARVENVQALAQQHGVGSPAPIDRPARRRPTKT